MSKVAKTMENLEHCKCASCPSFGVYCKAKALPHDTFSVITGLGKAKHFEGMFCAFEKSNCIHDEHGCNCAGCEVAHDYHLHKNYYCIHNAEE